MCHSNATMLATNGGPRASTTHVAAQAATEQSMQGELDELEREEFFRLKKVQDKKERDQKKKKAEVEAASKARAAAMHAPRPPPPTKQPDNMLPTQDQDIMF
jgi:V-type H+-transporting ATPase subunit D